jgi:uncharacterized protein (TIRG00374 family)
MSKLTKAFLLNKKLWSAIILLLFVVFVVFYVVNNWQEFTRLELQRPGFILLLAVMALINLYSTGRSMDAVLHPLGLRLGRFETFGLASVTRLCNMIAPGKIGIATRATYLKRKYKLSLTQFASSLAGAQIITYFISSAFGLFAIIVIGQQMNAPQLIPFALLLAGVMVGLLGLLLFSPKIKECNYKFLNHFIKTINGWHVIRKDQNTLLIASFWVIVNVLSQTFIIFAAFSSFGADISLMESIFIASINIFSVVIAITPAGIGITEGLIIVSASAVGLPVSLTLSVALLRRVTIFVLVFLATLFSSPKLFDKSIFELIKPRQKDTEY